MRAFCERISPGAKPVLISIQPEPECLPRECFENVRQKTKTHGGRIRCGWAIWEWPRVFIEAEYHAVYEAPDVSLHDLTPSIPEDPQRARLFLPDDSAVYDFGDPDGSRRDNIRHPLAKDPQIEQYLGLAADMAAIMLRVPGKGMVTLSDSDTASVQAIAMSIAKIQREIAQRYTARGAPCYCGSGLKFKRCHGRNRKS